MNRVSNICFVVAALLSLSGCTTKQAYVAKGNQYLKEGKDADAVINYRKAIQKDPLSGEAYYGLGLTFIRQADPKQAYFALSRAVELLPDNDEAKERLGELCISGYLRDPRHPLNLYNQIKDLAGKLLAKNPNSFQGLRLTGYLALEDRKPEEAIAMFRRALQVRPDDGSLTTFLAQILRHNSHAQEAETLALGFISQHKD